MYVSTNIGSNKLAKALFTIAMILGSWYTLLLRQLYHTDELLSSRAVILERGSASEMICTEKWEVVRGEYLNLKEKLRGIRREKNKRARELKLQELDCERKLESTLGNDIQAGTERSQLQFDMDSLTAKLGDNETLISHFRLIEALATVRGVLPIEVQRKKYSVTDLRNSLVVELSKLLEVEVSSLQHLLNIELMQQVKSL